VADVLKVCDCDARVQDVVQLLGADAPEGADSNAIGRALYDCAYRFPESGVRRVRYGVYSYRGADAPPSIMSLTTAQPVSRTVPRTAGPVAEVEWKLPLTPPAPKEPPRIVADMAHEGYLIVMWDGRPWRAEMVELS
jgi:hypothetical protein